MLEIGGGVYYIGAHYVIEIRTDENAAPLTIGFIDCKGRPYSDPNEQMEVVEVSYAMHPMMRRKGLTSLSLYVLSEYILEHVGGYDAVHLSILTTNVLQPPWRAHADLRRKRDTSALTASIVATGCIRCGSNVRRPTLTSCGKGA